MKAIKKKYFERIVSDVESIQKETLDTERNARLKDDLYDTASMLSGFYPTKENTVDAETIKTVTSIKEERFAERQVRKMIQAIEDVIAKNIDDRKNKAILEEERLKLLKGVGTLQEACNTLTKSKEALAEASKGVESSKGKLRLNTAKHETSILKIEAVQASIRELQAYIFELKMAMDETNKSKKDEQKKIIKQVCEDKNICLDQINDEIAYKEFLVDRSKCYINTILQPLADAIEETRSGNPDPETGKPRGKKFIVDGEEVFVNYGGEYSKYYKNRSKLLKRVNKKIAFVNREIDDDESRISKLKEQKTDLCDNIELALKDYDDKLKCQELNIADTEKGLEELNKKLEKMKKFEISKKDAVEEAAEELKNKEAAVQPLADAVKAAEADVAAKEAIVIAQSNRVKYIVKELVEASEAELNNAIQDGFESIFVPLDTETPAGATKEEDETLTL